VILEKDLKIGQKLIVTARKSIYHPKIFFDEGDIIIVSEFHMLSPFVSIDFPVIRRSNLKVSKAQLIKHTKLFNK